VVGLPGQLGGQVGEKPRPLGGTGRDDGQRGFDEGDLLGIHLAEPAEAAPAGSQRGLGQEVAAPRVLSDAGRGEQRVAIGGLASEPLGYPQIDHGLGVAGVVSGWRQGAQDGGVPAHRLIRRGGRQRPLAGGPRIMDGLGGSCGRDPGQQMERELTGLAVPDRLH
jgi:hypothetical protein